MSLTHEQELAFAENRAVRIPDDVLPITIPDGFCVYISLSGDYLKFHISFPKESTSAQRNAFADGFLNLFSVEDIIHNPNFPISCGLVGVNTITLRVAYHIHTDLDYFEFLVPNTKDAVPIFKDIKVDRLTGTTMIVLPDGVRVAQIDWVTVDLSKVRTDRTDFIDECFKESPFDMPDRISDELDGFLNSFRRKFDKYVGEKND